MKYLTNLLNKDTFKYLLIIVVVFVFFSQLKKILALFGIKDSKSESKQLAELLETANSDSDGLWSDTTAINVAEKVYNSMAGVGTDEKILEQVLSELEKSIPYNTALVFIKFGKRKYFWGSKALLFGTELNLSEWLNKELGMFDKKLLNRWNNQLSLAGVI